MPPKVGKGQLTSHRLVCCSVEASNELTSKPPATTSIVENRRSIRIKPFMIPSRFPVLTSQEFFSAIALQLLHDLSHGFFVIIRLYSPGKAYFDKTWKPDDVVKIK